MEEEKRYRAVSEQIAHLLDQAANDQSPGGMIGLGAVWLAAEMFDRNERSHERWQENQKKRKKRR